MSALNLFKIFNCKVNNSNDHYDINLERSENNQLNFQCCGHIVWTTIFIIFEGLLMYPLYILSLRSSFSWHQNLVIVVSISLLYLYLIFITIWSTLAYRMFLLLDIHRLKNPDLIQQYRSFERIDIKNVSLIKHLIGCIFLFSWKLIILGFFAVASYLTFRINMFVWSIFSRKNSNPASNLKLISSVRYCQGTLALLTLIVCGVYKIRNHNLDPFDPGNDNFNSENIISNHVSCLDILYYVYYFFPSFVSKATLVNNWFAGRVAILMRSVFVERGNEENRKKSLKAIENRHYENFADTERRNPPFVIFPEGTTSNGIGLIDFKKGAFMSLVPLKPIILIYSTSGFHPAFDILPMKVFVPMLLCSPNPITLDAYFLPTVYPPVDENSHNKELMQEKYMTTSKEFMFSFLKKYHPMAPIYIKSENEWHGSFRMKIEVKNALLNLKD